MDKPNDHTSEGSAAPEGKSILEQSPGISLNDMKFP